VSSESSSAAADPAASATPPRKPPITLTIAGFDPSSGAGITADLEVFAAHGLFGTACITALTVQSTQGVAAVEPVHRLIGPTIAHLDADLPPAGIKIGMLSTPEAIRAVADYLRRIRASGSKIPVVLDPVILSSSGASLLSEDGLSVLRRELLPLVDWITPNHAELTALTGISAVHYLDDALRAISRRHTHLHIVATGGDHIGTGTRDTLLTPTGALLRFEGERIDTTSTHGTGCAFSSALLSRLVLGDPPRQAVAVAKTYVTEAIRRAPGLGKGRGPLNLLWPLERR
jgi:hydroxymethylpyrimidine/phosphomethylpyrimidine kinase